MLKMFLSGVLLNCLLLSLSAWAEEDREIAALIDLMARDGRKFDPQPLVDKRATGMVAVLDHLFPETASAIEVRNDEIERLIGQLGDDSFNVREATSKALLQRGPECAGRLRAVIDHDDPEVRFRVRKILRHWEATANQSEERTQTIHNALTVYLAKVDDPTSRRELARRATKALTLRLHEQPAKGNSLKICLVAMAQWRIDQVHNELLPLLQQDDPAVAMFAMRAISGRTGNSYVAPIHMGALASGRRELVKCAVRSMPGPVWDRKNWPIIREVYVKIFDGDDPQWDFSDDPDFMNLAAFVAARDFRVAKARTWLLRKIAKGTKPEALRAIHALGDTYYIGNPVYPELLEVLEPHLKSDDLSLRATAVHTLGVYRGEAVVPLLIEALSDPDERVWKPAAEHLVNQQVRRRGDVGPIPELLRGAIRRTEDETVTARIETLLKYLEDRAGQSAPRGPLRWPK